MNNYGVARGATDGIRGAGGGETSVCAVGDGAQPMAGPICRIWARDGGRFVNRPYGDGGRIAAAVGPSIARPRIRRLRNRRAADIRPCGDGVWTGLGKNLF